MASTDQNPDDSPPGTRTIPGYTFKPLPKPSIFGRLHADHEIKLKKLEAKHEAEEREKVKEECVLAATRKATEEEVDEACSRLHNDAELRRQRLQKRREEQEYFELCQEDFKLGGRSRSSPAIGGEGSTDEPRWKRLYQKGAEKERKLEQERLRKAKQEEEYMVAHSVHRELFKAGADEEAFARLYEDSQQRELRREQQRAVEREEEERDTGDHSVHRCAQPVVAEEAAQRLYEDGLMRQKRLEAKRMKKHAEDNEKAAPRKPTAEGAMAVERRVDLLYSDAERRKQDRRLQQEAAKREQAEKLEEASVHHRMRHKEWSPDEVDQVFDRVANPLSRREQTAGVDATPPKRGLRTAPGDYPYPGAAAEGRPGYHRPFKEAAFGSRAPARPTTMADRVRPGGAMGSLARDTTPPPSSRRSGVPQAMCANGGGRGLVPCARPHPPERGSVLGACSSEPRLVTAGGPHAPQTLPSGEGLCLNVRVEPGGGGPASGVDIIEKAVGSARPKRSGHTQPSQTARTRGPSNRHPEDLEQQRPPLTDRASLHAPERSIEPRGLSSDVVPDSYGRRAIAPPRVHASRSLSFA